MHRFPNVVSLTSLSIILYCSTNLIHTLEPGKTDTWTTKSRRKYSALMTSCMTKWAGRWKPPHLVIITSNLRYVFLQHVCKISRFARAIPSKDIDLKPGSITHSQVLFLAVLMNFRLLVNVKIWRKKQPTKQIMKACTSHIILFLHTRMSPLVRHTFRAPNSVFAASELIRVSGMKEIYSHDSFVAWKVRTGFP